MTRREVWLATVGALVVMGGCGSIHPDAKVSQLVGYVFATEDAAGDTSSAFSLNLSADAPDIGYDLAFVRVLTSEGQTLERRTLPDGSFAAIVPEGKARITAYAPPYVDNVGPSEALIVDAAGDRVTRLDGIALGLIPGARRPADYFPLNAGDKQYWSTHDDGQQWWRFMCGTTDVSGTAAHILLTPNGWAPFVDRTTAAEAVGLGQVYVHGVGGSLQYVGPADLIREDNGDLGFRSHLFDRALTFPPLRLGEEAAGSGVAAAGIGDPIDVTLPDGVTLDDLYDPAGGTWEAVFPGEDGAGRVILAAVGQQAAPPAGNFTDTITIDWLAERDVDGATETTWQRITLAKGVGSVLDEGEVYDQPRAKALEDGELLNWWDDKLLFAEANGTDHGTYPTKPANGG